MGPHNDLPLDEILKAMAWIRHLYTGDVAEADWLTPEQKKVFTPYKPETHAAAEERNEERRRYGGVQGIRKLTDARST